MMATRTKKPVGQTCPHHGGVLVATPYVVGRRVVLKCPNCQYSELRARRTPKRAKDLVLTEIPLSEHEEQARLIEECQKRESDWPELSLLYAVPNASRRGYQEQQKIIAEGLRAGVPDLCLPVARLRYRTTHGTETWYHSLYIEMKVGDNKPTPKQLAWHKALRSAGHRVEVCYGWQAALVVILNYLAKNGEPEP